MHARSLLFVAAAMCFGLGCTHTALERRTVKQASTLTDLQHQQVMDNLAMFACNPDAMAWHVKVKGGLIQIADQGSGTFGAEFGLLTDAIGTGSKFIPGVSGQRGVVNQWDVDPAIDSDDLELLTVAYRKMLNPADEDIKKEIRFQIWKLFITFEFAPGASLILQIMVDAVKEQFDEYRKTLDTLPVEGGPDRILRAKEFLGKAESALVEAIELQRLGAIEKDEYGVTPTGEPKSKEVREALTNLKCALRVVEAELKLINLPEGEAKDRLESVKRRIAYLLDQGKKYVPREHLATILAYQNPVIARHLDYGSGLYLFHRDTLFPGFQANEDLLSAIGSRKYLIPPIKAKRQERNPGLADQAQSKMTTLRSLLTEETFQTPWFSCGSKHDVPKCACYVGRYVGCGRECYVWVLPGQMKALKEFTLALSTLAPLEKQDITGGRGAAFSPGIR